MELFFEVQEFFYYQAHCMVVDQSGGRTRGFRLSETRYIGQTIIINGKDQSFLVLVDLAYVRWKNAANCNNGE